MKVLHVIDSLGGSGGAEHGLVREIAGLSPDIDQRVCRLFAKDRLEPELERAGIAVSSLGLSADAAGMNWPLAIVRLVREIRAFEPDVLHSSLFTANLVAQWAGLLTGIPVLSTFTLSGDRGLLQTFQPGAASWKANVLRWIAARAARSKNVWFRALSQDALNTNTVLLGVSPGRVVVIPRGVPKKMVPEMPRTRRELGLPETGRIILNVGRQTAQKGHLYLLRAFLEVRQHVDAHLVIAGREGDTTKATLAEIQKLGLGSHVTLTGYTPLVPDYLAHADVFAFPSLMEGLGTSVLEAMAARVPVVGFDIPPVREATGDGQAARLVGVGDVGGLVAGILEALDPEVASRYVRVGQYLVEDRFSLAHITEQLEERLRELSHG